MNDRMTLSSDAALWAARFPHLERWTPVNENEVEAKAATDVDGATMLEARDPSQVQPRGP